jgi:hypothetical protein
MAIWSTYFTGVWYILWPFGIFYGYLVYFSRFGTLYQEKSGNPVPLLLLQITSFFGFACASSRLHFYDEKNIFEKKLLLDFFLGKATFESNGRTQQD